MVSTSRLTLHLLLATGLFFGGCRFSYEISDLGDGIDSTTKGDIGNGGVDSGTTETLSGGSTADGSSSLGGAADGGNSAIITDTGGKAGSGGDAAGGASSGGADGSGGSGSGGDAAGGASSGGAGSGGAGSGGAGSGGASSGGAGSGGAGSGGASSGGAGSGGASSGGAGSGGASSGGATGGEQFVVTTATDEQNAGATSASPGGNGLSFREALLLANSTPGPQTITFNISSLTLTLGVLPTIVESVSVNGPTSTQVAINASGIGSGSACLKVDTSNVTIDSIQMYGCQGQPVIFASGTGNQLSQSYLHDNTQAPAFYGDSPIVFFNYFQNSGGAGLNVYATNTQVTANFITNSAGPGIYIGPGANGTKALANVIIQANEGIKCDGASPLKIWHNTVDQAKSSALTAGSSTNIDARNNIFSNSASYGVVKQTGSFTQLDYNLYYNNTSGNCSGCSVGTHSQTGNPLYTNSAGLDLSLKSGSPAIDKGFDLGEDRNLDTAGLYNGAGPDIGYIEAN